MRRCPPRSLLVSVAILFVGGCQQISSVMPNSSWHQKCGWKAEDYFDDPQVIALCTAIEANDLVEMKRLVDEGANVNAKGKDNMTPLLWAYPDNKLDRLTLLLERGADPNVVFESDFRTGGIIRKGDSVTHLACATSIPGYFEVVFEHGGNPNLIKNGIIPQDTPLFTLIKGSASNKLDEVNVLIAKGANLDHMNGAWATPVMQAVSWGAQYDIALLLLESGADHRIYQPKSNSRLVHQVLSEEIRRSKLWTPQQEADYLKLLKWLEDHGESIEQAKADRKRWASWDHATGEYQRKMAQEVAQRQAREAREKKAPDAEDNDAKQSRDVKQEEKP